MNTGGESEIAARESLVQAEEAVLNQGLVRMNRVDAQCAEREFLRCCHSTQWARNMSRERPFRFLHELFQTADRIWWDLGPEDWREAFQGHPQIGAASSSFSHPKGTEHWSAEEQCDVRGTTQSVLDELQEANRAYLEKFGFTFIVCATGKSSQEILPMLLGRLQRDREAELRSAAEEQRRITHLRLRKLLLEI